MKGKILIVIVLLFLCLSGCSDSESKNSKLDYKKEEKKGTVYFLNNRREEKQAYEKIAKAYEKETGVIVFVQTVSEKNYEKSLGKALTDAAAPSLFLIDGMDHFAKWEEYCDDISDSKICEYLSDGRLAICDEGQGVYGIPSTVEGYGIVYNEEILERYLALEKRKSSIQSVEQIRDYETLEEVVRDLYRNRKELGIEGVFSDSCLKGKDRIWWSKYLFGSVLADEWISSEMNENRNSIPKLEFRDSDCIEKWLILLKKYSVSKGAKFENTSRNDSLIQFATGKTAMLLAGNRDWEKMQDKDSALSSEKVRMLPIYLGNGNDENRGIAVGSDQYLAVNSFASSRDREATLDFLEWLYGTAQGKKLVLEELSDLAPFNTFSANDIPANPLSREVIRYLNEENRQNLPWVFQRFPEGDFEKRLSKTLRLYNQGNMDSLNFRKKIKEEWVQESIATKATKGYNK